ncbi:FHA domain-containing protein [Adlercreutzia equolifaciens]|uniref:FHA domain-containing protein n=1 Tax=Adlercreutzia equolifaciens TaxID=446660 RepID=UPI0003898B59|nr:FHA domain-containing protein [Adlercreutzia equolifaciens]RFT84100.1 hypothetical protein DX903_02320 [Adlercreutzia equolifaciens]BAN76480.1 conserved hypothetical protein [Adlercreutzia equolifaciens DSM 19450]
MRLCSCGFANPDDATHCAACGSALTHESAGGVLLLEEVRSGQVVRVTAPGGILGRAGDFSPDLFSPRVSGVHAVVATNAEGHWTIEHTGRNASAVERGGIWSDLRCGAPQPLFGGETLKLADMVFRVRVGTQEAVAEGATAESDAQDAPAETAWSVRCPVCGTEYAVEGPKSHITTCAFCKDPLDARQIARVAARAVPDR